MATEDSDYPVSFTVERDARQSRLTNFPLGIGTLIRLILAIPHIIVVSLLGFVAGILYFVATFVILFTGVYPREFFNFMHGYLRWNNAVNAYALSLSDKYPPFTLEERPGFAVSLGADYPVTSSRLLNLPFLAYYIRGLLLIPHAIILFFLAIALYLVILIAQFAILFTGAFPPNLHAFCVGVMLRMVRMEAYVFGLTDRYPPFSTTQ